MAATFSITNHTRGRMPRIPFKKMKEAILGTRYELSAAMLTPKDMRGIAKRTKGKEVASNVLSFPLSKKSGELLLCPATARAQAKEYAYTERTFLALLFIHGLLHLKGYSHGGTMESEERRIGKRFGFTF